MTIKRASDVAESDGITLRPSSLDAIALVGVVIGGVVLIQYGWVGATTSTRYIPSEVNIIIRGLHKARHVLNAVTPVGFGLAVVAIARVLCEQGPRRRRLFLQPGVAACVAFVAALITGATNQLVWAVGWFESRGPWSAADGWTNALFNWAQMHLSFCVLAVWAFLAFGGLWKEGRNWVNRLGIALGVMSVGHPLLWCLS